jgi:uncharacterized protein YqgV (UPF0045/DUF77 family)
MKKIVYELVTTSGFTEQVSPMETTIDERRRIIEVLKDQLAKPDLSEKQRTVFTAKLNLFESLLKN